MRKFVTGLLAAALSAGACAQSPAQPQPQPTSGVPKLLVVISVDQFSADLWDEYRPQFTGGLARLASGAAFRNGYQSHAATETCPGHSTILTGDHPSRTGIIGNLWIDQSIARSDKAVYCVEDEEVPGSSSAHYTVSPKHLMVPTLGDLLKAARPGSRNVAVAGKDRAAVMMTGHHADQRWYWDGARFATDLTGARVPQSLPKANAAIAAALAQPRPGLEAPPLCQAKARQIPIEGGGKPVGAGSFARNAGDANAFRASPELDGDTLAIAAALVDELQLGRRADPDVLAISLSATDYVGHTYGTEGEEMCLQLLSLDRDLGDFLSLLDSRKIDYVVALTADHGGLDVPERLRLAGVTQAARIGPDLDPGKIGAKLVQQLGLPGNGLLGLGSSGDVYVDRALSQRDRKRVLDAAVAAYRSHPMVEEVFTADQIAATPMPMGPPDRWSLIERTRASYYPGRSGDFVVILKKEITPIYDTSRYVATHGSPWDYDRRVPILFWRAGMRGAAHEEAVETVDIMPTLAAMIGFPLAVGSVDGKCLASVASCPASAHFAPERGQR
jgi:predicted AlkP superfamily pyrophosphatase or phosphodiesterase